MNFALWGQATRRWSPSEYCACLNFLFLLSNQSFTRWHEKFSCHYRSKIYCLSCFLFQSKLGATSLANNTGRIFRMAVQCRSQQDINVPANSSSCVMFKVEGRKHCKYIKWGRLFFLLTICRRKKLPHFWLVESKRCNPKCSWLLNLGTPLVEIITHPHSVLFEVGITCDTSTSMVRYWYSQLF